MNKKYDKFTSKCTTRTAGAYISFGRLFTIENLKLEMCPYRSDGYWRIGSSIVNNKASMRCPSQKSIPPSNGWEFLDKLGQWQEDSSLACIPKPPEFHANLSCKSYHIKAKDCHGVDQAGLSGTFDRLNGEWRAGRPVRFIHIYVCKVLK